MRGLHIEYIALLLLVPSTIASALSTMKGALMPDLPSTRERLVSAAFELFEERGYEATSVDDIATRAGWDAPLRSVSSDRKRR